MCLNAIFFFLVIFFLKNSNIKLIYKGSKIDLKIALFFNRNIPLIIHFDDEKIEEDLKNQKDGTGSTKLHFELPILIDWNGFLPTSSANR